MAQNRNARVGDRVRINGGRWDGDSGVVERVVESDSEVMNGFLSGFINEPMALVKLNAPREMVDGVVSSVSTPVRRLQIL